MEAQHRARGNALHRAPRPGEPAALRGTPFLPSLQTGSFPAPTATSVHLHVRCESNQFYILDYKVELGHTPRPFTEGVASPL